jgi:hypothetical protein
VAQALERVALVRAGVLDAFLGGFARAVLDQVLPAVEVRAAVEEHALGRQPVATRAAGLLAVLLDALRQARVDDEAHVGAIDPHPEGDRRDDDVEVFRLERALRAPAARRVEAGVVGLAADAERAQGLRELLDVAAAQAVDDPGRAGVPRDHAADLAREVAAREDAVRQVRPVEAPDEERRIGEPELAHDVLADARRRGRGVGLDRDRGQLAAELAELAVLGAEIVAPVADAVRLVDRDRGQAAGLEALEEPRAHQALGGDVQEPQLAARERALDLAPLRAFLGAREHRGRRAVLAQRVDLVLHQRDQRADDHRQARAHESRGLVAQALPAARRHHEQRVPARERRADRLALERAQRLEPKVRRTTSRTSSRGSPVPAGPGDLRTVRGPEGSKEGSARPRDRLEHPQVADQAPGFVPRTRDVPPPDPRARGRKGGRLDQSGSRGIRGASSPPPRGPARRSGWRRRRPR